METVMVKKRPPLPKKLQLDVFRSDGWICRWCKRPVIFAPAMNLLLREAQQSGRAEPLAYYHRNWTHDGAPLLDELGAVIDHVNACSTGGGHTADNLATACNKCNGRKSAASVVEWNERPKKKPVKGKYGKPQYWDGLSTLFVALAQRDPVGLTPSEKGWLKAFSAGSSVANATGQSHRK
jgi:5-methylcytosine-specific restriction endonuclease McrA